MKQRAVIIGMLIPLSLAACGGGPGGPTSPAALAPSQLAAQSAELVNGTRGARQVTVLGVDPLIAEVARAHSEAMRDQGFFGHTGPSGEALRDRLRAAGVSFRSAGENLAQVQDAVDPAGSAHAQLMGSQGHKENILGSRFALVGVGVARDGSSYWITQIFVEP